MLSAYLGFPMFWDSTYILIIIGALLSLGASAYVKSTYRKYEQVRNMRGLTGAEAARQILQAEGLFDVRVMQVSGNLTDHYDPSAKVLSLSENVHNSASVAAVGVAAHECGHAIQDHKSYVPLKLRTGLVPVANFGAMISWPLIIIGLMLRSDATLFLIDLGIILFSAAVLFQLVTLPVEINASRRAVRVLAGNNMLYDEEVSKVKKVLGAAAMTYVAAAAASVLQLVRLLLITGGRRRD